jgi:hypothetical protein
MAKRSDEEMAEKLIERLKLVVAMDDDIPTEAKLEIQPMLREIGDAIGLERESVDEVRLRHYADLILESSDEDPNVAALLGAFRKFAPFLSES